MSDENASLTLSPLSARPPKNPELLCRLLIREGKSFYDSALQAGYPQSTGRKGLQWMLDHSRQFAALYSRESSRQLVSLDALKPLAVQRLHSEITNPKSPQAMKAIELAGRFKEADWFVRNADATVGVFVALGERKEAITAQADVIDSYSDE